MPTNYKNRGKGGIMAGTKAGAKKASETMKKIYGNNWYCKIGSIGGKAHVDKGFACMPYEKRSEAGRKGGSISKRGKIINRKDNHD